MRYARISWAATAQVIATCLILAATLAACGPVDHGTEPVDGAEVSEPLTAQYVAPRRLVDLSPTLSEDLPQRLLGKRFLDDFGFPPTNELEVVVTEDPYYGVDSWLTMFTHVGPHVDAPNHVVRDAPGVDQLDLDSFFGPAVFLDLSAKAKDQPLSRADFEGKVKAGDRVIAYVGYQPPQADDELPSYAYLSGDAAEYLATLPVMLFATDMPSLGGIRNYYQLIEDGVQGTENFLPEHHAFMSRHVPAIEGLAHLDQLVGESNIVFAGFPLKIEDGDGGPMRPVALLY